MSEANNIFREGPTLRTSSQQEIATPTKSSAKETTKKITTKQITYVATLTAITLMLKMLGNMAIIGGSIKISFTYIGWILSAVILGPFGGAVVGFTTDVLGTFIIPSSGSVDLVLTLGYTMYPLIVGLFYKYLPIKNKNISLTLGVAVASVVCTLGICSAALYYRWGMGNSMSFITYVLVSRTWQLPTIVLNLIITMLLIPALKRAKVIDVV